MYESECVRASCVCVWVSCVQAWCVHTWDWWMCVCRTHTCARAILTDVCVCACVCACTMGWQATLAYLSLPVVLVITQTISQKILQVCVWMRHTNTHIYTYIQTCIQTNKNNFTCVDIFIYTYMYMHVSICIWHTCIQSYICEYFHTIFIREHIAQIFQVCVRVCVCMCICIYHTRYVHTRPHVCPPGVTFSMFWCVHVACMHSHTRMYVRAYIQVCSPTVISTKTNVSTLSHNTLNLRMLCMRMLCVRMLCVYCYESFRKVPRSLSLFLKHLPSQNCSAPGSALSRARVLCSPLEHKHTHTQYSHLLRRMRRSSRRNKSSNSCR